MGEVASWKKCKWVVKPSKQDIFLDRRGTILVVFLWLKILPTGIISLIYLTSGRISEVGPWIEKMKKLTFFYEIKFFFFLRPTKKKCYLHVNFSKIWTYMNWWNPNPNPDTNLSFEYIWDFWILNVVFGAFKHIIWK